MFWRVSILDGRLNTCPNSSNPGGGCDVCRKAGLIGFAKEFIMICEGSVPGVFREAERALVEEVDVLFEDCRLGMTSGVLGDGKGGVGATTVELVIRIKSGRESA